MERNCRLCGVAFTPSPSAPGRPRVHCLACRPPKVPKPRVLMEASCEQCGQTFVQPMRTSRFCSDSCRNEHRRLSGYRSPGSKSFCAECGAAIHVSSSSAANPMCRQCRRAQVKHGDLAMYEKRGCRCDPCREAKVAAGRDYAARRAASGNPIKPSRKTCTYTCEQCGAKFTSSAYGPPSRFCSMACVGLSRRIDSKRGSFSISRARRLAIYERDNWTCQICGEATDPGADPVGGDWYPTLDHIIPQSHMLFPDHSDANLRTAHRWCNTVRGDLSCHTDDDLRLVV